MYASYGRARLAVGNERCWICSSAAPLTYESISRLRGARGQMTLSADIHQGPPRYSWWIFEFDRSPTKFCTPNDGAQLTSLRYKRWKAVFMEQLAEGQAVWRDPWVELRAPKIFDLRMDPFEKADLDSNTYEDWWVRRAFLIVPTQPLVGGFLATLKEYPPSQEPASFNLDRIFEEFLSQPGTH